MTIEPIDITPEDSVVPVYLVPLSPEEVAEREQWQLEDDQRTEAEQQREKVRKSALKKLEKLGLTEDEVKAVLGAY